MRYIKDKEKLNYLKNSTKKEDKDFLLNFMDMPEEEAQKYLATINVGEPKNEWENIIIKLIEDEIEAIQGYNRANSYIDNNKKYENKRELINKIINDERNHINWLKEIKNG